MISFITGLVAKAEKNLSDQSDFLQYKAEMDSWIQKATEILDGCAVGGDMHKVQQDIDTLNVSQVFQQCSVSSHMSLSFSR